MLSSPVPAPFADAGLKDTASLMACVQAADTFITKHVNATS
jgi:hypothetical protein